jgi:hypothetical protein
MHLSKLLRGFVLLFGLFVVTTTAFGEELKATPKAREHFNAGLAHVDDPAGPKYEEAYREFKAAYAETPSYEIALNVGYCAFFLERDAEALEMYELYLSKADTKEIPKKKRIQMDKDIQSLRSGLVKVELKVTPSKATVVDERFPSKGANIVNRYPIENGVAQLGIHAGAHRFTITSEGYQPQSWEFEAQPASTHAHEFKLVAVDADKPVGEKVATAAGPSAPAVQSGATAGSSLDGTASEQTKRRTSPMVYVGAIVTGVFAAGAIGTGLVAKSKKSDFEAANDGTQYSTAEGLRSDAKTFALVSDICLGAAVLSAGVTTYFIFAGGSSAAAPASKAQWKLAPAIGSRQAGLAVTGTF